LHIKQSKKTNADAGAEAYDIYRRKCFMADKIPERGFDVVF
jgi:hypothetical protein